MIATCAHCKTQQTMEARVCLNGQQAKQHLGKIFISQHA